MKERALEPVKAAVEFRNAKNAYVSCRLQQRKIIADYLKETFAGEKDFDIKQSQGKENYKGSIPEGGLNNWKWIELWKNGMYYFISLQPFDQDPESKNYHVIYDRIGIFSCNIAEKEHLEKPWKGDKKGDGKRRFNKYISSFMRLTDIALPIDSEETLKKLADLLQ